MEISSIYRIYKNLEEENVIFSFKGSMTADLLASILNSLEFKLDLLNESPRIKKKMFNVLVECLQNLYHHSEAKLSEIRKNNREAVLILVSKLNDQYYISTGNYIENYNVVLLKNRIDEINELDKEALREYYQEKLAVAEVSLKGTAGLGMIDIARKSGHKLEYNFLKVDDEVSFFCLNVLID